ncbi:integrase, partial [Streptococcus pneumoniae]|nr:integrase [Streptococcus pneumoniae]
MQDILSGRFVFTYIDTRGNINKPLHADYLN